MARTQTTTAFRTTATRAPTSTIASTTPPPDELAEVGAFECLSAHMQLARLDRVVIVQPVNYAFDHSAIQKALLVAQGAARGVLLVNPSRGPEQIDEILAMSQTALAESGIEGDGSVARLWTGVRFNPALFSDAGMTLDGEVGAAIFKRCGDLGLTASFMEFDGIAAHAGAIKSLIRLSPATKVVMGKCWVIRLFIVLFLILFPNAYRSYGISS